MVSLDALSGDLVSARLSQRLDLGATETRLMPLDNLRRALGPKTPKLWIKRDDLMPRALGGNKLRKLEFLFAAAQKRGARAIATIGAAGSNHLRITTAAARMLGFETVAFMTGPESARSSNRRVIELASSEVIFIPPQQSLRESIDWAKARFAEWCQQRFGDADLGFWITLGGSTVEGDLGYVLAARELAQQLRAADVQLKAIVCGVGSGGTLAGLAVGSTLFLSSAEIIGYSVAVRGIHAFSGLPSTTNQAHALASSLDVDPAKLRFRVEYDQVGKGYGVVTDAGENAIRLLAQTEAILLDPVYTGKAFAGYLSEIESGRYQTQDNLLFMHTGGLPGLFDEHPR